MKYLLASMFLATTVWASDIGDQSTTAPSADRAQAAPGVAVHDPVPGPFQSERQTVVIPPSATAKEKEVRESQRDRKIQRLQRQLAAKDLPQERREELEKRLGELQAKKMIQNPPPTK